MTPWLSIWFKPRQTIRQIVDANPRRGVLPLAIAAGAATFVMSGLGLAMRAGMSPWLALPMCLGLGTLTGLLWLYLFGWLYRWVGSWFGGQAKNVDVRAAIAWVEVPRFVVFVMWLIMFLLVQDPTAAEGELSAAAFLAFLLFGVVALTVWVWRLVLACHALGEVHRFSAWKGLATLAIPNGIIGVVVVIPLTAISIALLAPRLSGRTASAYEAMAVDTLHRADMALKLYELDEGTYPATWQQLQTAPQGPYLRVLQAEGPLTNYEEGGYLYTYAADADRDYVLTAVPKEATSRSRSFYLDGRGTRTHCVVGAQDLRATADDAPLNEPARPCSR